MSGFFDMRLSRAVQHNPPSYAQVRGLTRCTVASEEEALMQYFAGEQGRVKGIIWHIVYCVVGEGGGEGVRRPEGV